MTRYLVVIPGPEPGQLVEIHRAETMAEAIYVAGILAAKGCAMVGLAQFDIDVNETFNALVSTLEGMPNE